MILALGDQLCLTALQFDTLDVGVQEEFEKFLQERGVNESLALFIPEYAESKEQKVWNFSCCLIPLLMIYCRNISNGWMASSHSLTFSR